MNRHARRRAAATARRPSVIQPAVSGESLLAAIPRPLVEEMFALARQLEEDADPGMVLVVDLGDDTVRAVHGMLAPADLFHHVVAVAVEADGRGVGLVVRRGAEIEAGVLGALIPHAGAA